MIAAKHVQKRPAVAALFTVKLPSSSPPSFSIKFNEMAAKASAAAAVAKAAEPGVGTGGLVALRGEPPPDFSKWSVEDDMQLMRAVEVRNIGINSRFSQIGDKPNQVSSNAQGASTSTQWCSTIYYEEECW